MINCGGVRVIDAGLSLPLVYPHIAIKPVAAISHIEPLPATSKWLFVCLIWLLAQFLQMWKSGLSVGFTGITFIRMAPLNHTRIPALMCLKKMHQEK